MGSGGELDKEDTFEMKQGSHWSQVLRHKTEDENKVRTPVDITNFDARCKVKKRYKDTTAVFELTKANGKIVFTDPTNGEFKLKLTDTETAAVTINPAGGKDATPSLLLVFDIELIDTLGDVGEVGEVVPFLRGNIKIFAEVTN